MRMTWRHAAPAACLTAAALVLGTGARIRGDAASIMIWPLNPVVRSDDRAAAVWIENRGSAAVTLQVRVLKWEVDQYTDRYIEQHDAVVGSPPMATIDAGQRQLIRLMKLQQPPPGTEVAYRVIIDELPGSPRDARLDDTPASFGVTFRMRYSLPLFLYGEGLPPVDRSNGDQAVDSVSAGLSWTIANDPDGQWLHVRNAGPRHARLTDVQLTGSGEVIDVARGLLGYALPGRELRWPLPSRVAVEPADAHPALVARVNGSTAVVLPRHP